MTTAEVNAAIAKEWSVPDFQPMTNEERETARLRVESFRADTPTSPIIQQGDVLYLGKALATVRDREARLRRAVEALAELVDWQNGCPLPTMKWKKGWGDAMKKCEASLAENADLLKGESP